MPNFKIYYFVIKQIPVPFHTGTSGPTAGATGGGTYQLDFTNTSFDSIRNTILQNFESNLVTLFQSAARKIPHAGSRRQTISVTRIPAQSANTALPNFAGLSSQPSFGDPIIYFASLASAGIRIRATDPHDQDPFMTMLDDLRRINSQEFPRAHVTPQISHLQSPRYSANETAGMAFAGFGHVNQTGLGYSPAVAKVFSNGRFTWDASNWQDLLAYSYAATAYHEIAHCKAECPNRRRDSRRRWLPAITASNPNVTIHDASRTVERESQHVAILSASGGIGRAANVADYIVQGEHMLCPINFYKYKESLNNQCFNNGRIMPLTQP